MKWYKSQTFAYLVGLALGLGYVFLKEPDVKTVTKFQERVKTVTKIVKNKDGSSTTIISEDRNTKLDQTKTSNKKDWHIAIGQTVTEATPIYLISVDRRILGDIYIGAFGTSDASAGLRIGFSF